MTNELSNGNCGFYGMMLGLEKMGKIKLGRVTVAEFRKELWEYGRTNEMQIRNAALPESQKKSAGKAISWTARCLGPIVPGGTII
jgi:hypothetical protein